MSDSLIALQLQLDELQEGRRKHEAAAAAAQSQLRIGLLGLLIGAGLAFVLSSAWYVGAFIALAGALASMTQAGKRSDARAKLAEVESQIAGLRAQMIERAGS